MDSESRKTDPWHWWGVSDRLWMGMRTHAKFEMKMFWERAPQLRNRMHCIVGGRRDIRLQTNKIYERNAAVRPHLFCPIPILANSVGSRLAGLSACGATSVSEWRRVCAWRLCFPTFSCPPNAFGLIFSSRISIFFLVSFSFLLFFFLDIKCFWNVPGENISEMKCAMFRIFHRWPCSRHKWMCDYAALASSTGIGVACARLSACLPWPKKRKSPAGVCMKMGDETTTKMQKWNALLCGASVLIIIAVIAVAVVVDSVRCLFCCHLYGKFFHPSIQLAAGSGALTFVYCCCVTSATLFQFRSFRLVVMLNLRTSGALAEPDWNFCLFCKLVCSRALRLFVGFGIWRWIWKVRCDSWENGLALLSSASSASFWLHANTPFFGCICGCWLCVLFRQFVAMWYCVCSMFTARQPNAWPWHSQTNPKKIKIEPNKIERERASK